MITLAVLPRTVRKKQVKTLRMAGIVPCVLYGPKIKPVDLQVPEKELDRLYREVGSSTLVTLDMGEKDKEHIILLHAIQKHPVTRQILHADFYELPLDKEITLSVSLILDGEAPGARDEGGTLVQSIYEVEIHALPTKLPPELHVDVSSLLHVEDALRIKDIAVPEGVKITNEAEETIAFIEAPRVEEVFEDKIEEDLDDIKTEGEVKRDEAEPAKGSEGEEAGPPQSAGLGGDSGGE